MHEGNSKTQLSLYNSLTREKAPFAPKDGGHVKMYACGPTVYSYAHIGNARMAVVFDTLARLMRTLYPNVTYVSNITDIDDKIIAASAESGEAIKDITTRYARIYNEDLAALHVVPPDIQPLATSHIHDMIHLIEKLIDAGHAYEAEQHVLFHVPSYPAYGRLSGRNRDDQVAGARVEVAPYKKDPADFVLWKPSTQEQPGWDSPWGRGRPGWHIECSAMAEAHLGLPFDIHGGGADLKFPHHENEIAQSCCAGGIKDNPASFARVWVHNGFVTVEGEKMSKSLGNIRLTHDLIKEWPGEVLRLALLSAHYRQPLDWTQDRLRQVQKNLQTLYQRWTDLKDTQADTAKGEALLQPVRAALLDDLNTPLALSHMLAIANDKETSSEAVKYALAESGALMGILNEETMPFIASTTPYDIDSYAVEALLKARTEARDAKDFSRADEIRDQLAAMNIEIKDGPKGTSWTTKKP